MFIACANLALLDVLADGGIRKAIRVNLAVAASWALGFFGSFVLKILATAPVVGAAATLGPFYTQLAYRTGAQGEGRLHAFITSLGELFRHTPWLFYRFQPSRAISIAVAAIALAGWIAAAYALRKARRAGVGVQALRIGLGYLTGSMFVALWVFALPQHTQQHAWFTVRYVVIWVAGGWAWALAERSLISAQAHKLLLVNAETLKVTAKVTTAVS